MTFYKVVLLIVAVVGLFSGGLYAWADVKSDIAVGAVRDTQHEANYERIDKKLDTIIEHLIGDNRGQD